MSRPPFTGLSETSKERAARDGRVDAEDSTATVSPGNSQRLIVVHDHGGIVVEQITPLIDYNTLSASDTSREAFYLEIEVKEYDDNTSTDGQYQSIMQFSAPMNGNVDFNQPIPVKDGQTFEVDVVYGDNDATGDVDVFGSAVYRYEDY